MLQLFQSSEKVNTWVYRHMVGCPLPVPKHSHRVRGENKRAKPRKSLHQDKGSLTRGRKKKPILKEQAAKWRTFLIASHRNSDAQPVSKQSHLRSQNPSCFSTQVLLLNMMLYGLLYLSLWPAQVSCSSYVPSKERKPWHHSNTIQQQPKHWCVLSRLP